MIVGGEDKTDLTIRHDCDCWRLTEPLGRNDQLPDHICPETEIGTIRAAMRDGVLPEFPYWPPNIDNGNPVRFVVRQWAEEAPSKALAQALGVSYRWGELVLRLRGQDSLASVTDGNLARMLGEQDLPQTPGAVQHLRAVAAGTPDPPAPTRGLLVTTIARTLPPHDVSIAGQLDTTTADHIARVVGPMVGHHRRFVIGVVGRLHDTDINYAARKIARSQRRELSYELAAWDERQIMLDQNLYRPNDIEKSITDYLSKIDNRVRAARKRAKLSTSVPPGWREKVRPKLQEWLSSQF